MEEAPALPRINPKKEDDNTISCKDIMSSSPSDQSMNSEPGLLARCAGHSPGSKATPSSRMPGNHVHGNGLSATFVPSRRDVCEGFWAANESLKKNHSLLFSIAS